MEKEKATEHRERAEKVLQETIVDRDSCKKRMKKLARKTKELAEEVEAKDEMAKLVEKEQQEVQIAAIGCIYDRSKVKKFIGDVATRSPSVKSGQVRQYITCKLCK